MKKKFFKIIGILFGVILFSVIWETMGILIGGNFGCSEIINTITRLNWYESCGNFGWIVWGGVWGIIGFLIYKKSILKTRYSK